MFSFRFNWDLTPNRLSKVLEDLKAAGKDVIDLTESNPTVAGFSYEGADILAALAFPQSLLYQPSPRGLLAARRAIADYYAGCGKSIPPESIFLTAGTSEAYSYLFKLLADPGDEIFIPQPGYPLLESLIQLESLRALPYPLKYNDSTGWHMDLETLDALISPKTKAVVVVSPNNPTGSYLKHMEMSRLNDLCAHYGLALIIDEVFSDYGCGQDHRRVRTSAANSGALTFVLNGFSKILALPQVKLGWILVSGPEPICAHAQERLEFIADTYLSVGTPVQHATARLLALREGIQKQVAARTLENYRFLETALSRASRCRVLIREGGWYAVVNIQDELSDEERTYQLLEQDHVYVHPGYFYDFSGNGFLVVSLLTPTARFHEGITRIICRLARH